MFVRRILVASTRSSIVRCYGTAKEVSSASTTPSFDRIGDDGFSKTLDGQRLPKDNYVFKALGSTEELLSFLGLAREHVLEVDNDCRDYLRRTQTVIIELSLSISRFNDKNTKSISSHYITEVEEWIEEFSKKLQPPEEFLIPSGGMASTSLLYARALCRRAEREVVPLVRAGLATEAQIYLNRLADFLQVASRFVAKAEHRTENIYVPVPPEEASSGDGNVPKQVPGVNLT